MDFVFRKSTKTNMKSYGTLQARFRSGGSSKCCSLGIVIKEAEWDKYRSGKWVPSNLLTSLGIKYGDFASILAELKNTPEEDFQAKKIKKTIEKAIAKSREVDDKEKHLIINKDELLFSEYLLKYYEDLKSGKRLKKQESVPVSDSYISEIKSLRSSILKYEEVCNKHFLLCDIDSMFRSGFISWLSEQGKKVNTINGMMAKVRTVMRTAFEDGLTKNDAFLKKGFVPKGEKADAVYLSYDRLKAWIDFDLSNIREFRRMLRDAYNQKVGNGKKTNNYHKDDVSKIGISKDIFIVGCLTGQRVSDYMRINEEMIGKLNGKTFITLVQQKTKKKVMIPLDKRVKKILEKYDGKLPKINQITFNNHLKLIAEALGWTEIPTFDRERADVKEDHRFCDMISSHTARRTFATIAYSKNVPLASIMAVTGHSTEEKLRTYLRLEAEDMAILAANDLNGFLRLKKPVVADKVPSVDTDDINKQ